MTSWMVSDSGILIATGFNETYTQQAATLWQTWDDQDIQIAAPYLFWYEVVAVVRKNVNRGIVSVPDGQLILDGLLKRTINVFSSAKLLKRAYEIATLLNRPTAYDSQYLAVAEYLGCEFWTMDQRLKNAAQHQFSWIKWIGEFTPSKNE